MAPLSFLFLLAGVVVAVTSESNEIAETPISWKTDCGSTGNLGRLEMTSCNSFNDCNVIVGSSHTLKLTWGPALDYKRLNYHVGVTKIFPHQEFVFSEGSSGPYNSSSVHVHSVTFVANTTFQGTGEGWELFLVLESPEGIVDVCVSFPVSIINDFTPPPPSNTTTTTQTERPSTTEEAFTTVNVTEVPVTNSTDAPVTNGTTIIVTTDSPVINVTDSTTEYVNTTAPVVTTDLPPYTNVTTTTTERPSNSTLAPPTTPSSGGDFSCQAEGTFPDPKDCSAFHSCFYDDIADEYIDTIQTCPPPLVYCDRIKNCDWIATCPCDL